MKVFNVDNENITINGNIYCDNDITFLPTHLIDVTYDTIQYDFHIKGDLYIFCDRLYMVGNEDIINNSLSVTDVLYGISDIIIDSNLSCNYDKNDFRVIKADRVYLRCPNLKVGKDIYAFYIGFDEVRRLKLEKIYE
jgi:hypothetical protein